ncbi:uncharacterized protein [Littorina saxatilis]|uniref:uncharacterized protein n=1 Tax=Littorina saxatilis TaxID=31220 RepID=UPI0038B5775F
MGLDLELFEEEVPEELICAVCNKVLVHPVESTCTHLFCGACLKKRLKKEETRTCPKCDTRLNHKTKAPSVPLKVRLLNLLIRCSYDCEKICKLSEMPDHVSEECPRAPVACPHMQNGCWMKVRRGELEEHVGECQHRKVNCEACGQRIVFIDLFTHQSRKKCLEKKLRQQLIKAIRETNSDVRQHKRFLDHQHVRLEQQQRQLFMDHFRQTNPAARNQHNYLYNGSRGSSNESVDYAASESPRPVHVATLPMPAETSRSDSERLHANANTTLRPDSERLHANANATLRPHSEELQVSASQIMTSHPELERLHTNAFMTSGLRRTEDGEMTIVFNTPSPSRADQPLVLTCRTCNRPFREPHNSPHSCRWHAGVSCFYFFLIFFFGGVGVSFDLLHVLIAKVYLFFLSVFFCFFLGNILRAAGWVFLLRDLFAKDSVLFVLGPG